jgi:hypothetical protein
MPVGVGDQQGAVVRRDRHAIGEGEVLGDHLRRAVRRDKRDEPGCTGASGGPAAKSKFGLFT